MTLPIISGYTAATIAIFQVILMMTVGFARQKNSVSVGDGGGDALLLKIRRHGNLTENAPIFLILVTLLEISGGPHVALIALASLFLAARLSHAFALSGPNRPVPARAFGAFGTILSIVGSAGVLIWHFSSVT